MIKLWIVKSSEIGNLYIGRDTLLTEDIKQSKIFDIQQAMSVACNATRFYGLKFYAQPYVL